MLWTAEAEDGQREAGADVTWCAVCGAYSSTKIYKLRGECPGPADKAALTRLRALQNLRHPVLGYRLKKPHRTTDEFMDAMEVRGYERRRLYDEAMRMQDDEPSTGDPGDRTSAASRLVLDGHSAGSCDDARAVPSWHAAPTMGTQTTEVIEVDGCDAGDHAGDDHRVGDAGEHFAGDMLEDAGRQVTVAITETRDRTAPTEVASGGDVDVQDDEYDVFGHGGCLDEQHDTRAGHSAPNSAVNPAPRLVSSGHSAEDSDNRMRAVLDRHVAATTGYGGEARVMDDDKLGYVIVGSDMQSGLSASGGRGDCDDAASSTYAGGGNKRTTECNDSMTAAARSDAAAARIRAVRLRVAARLTARAEAQSRECSDTATAKTSLAEIGGQPESGRGAKRARVSEEIAAGGFDTVAAHVGSRAADADHNQREGAATEDSETMAPTQHASRVDGIMGPGKRRIRGKTSVVLATGAAGSAADTTDAGTTRLTAEAEQQRGDDESADAACRVTVKRRRYSCKRAQHPLDRGNSGTLEAECDREATACEGQPEAGGTSRSSFTIGQAASTT